MFAVKGPRFITHMKKLSDPDILLANFFASGVLALEAKLGPVLWQLPPTLGFDEKRLVTFFEALPRTTPAAAQLATQHDERLEGQSAHDRLRRPAGPARDGGQALELPGAALPRRTPGARRRGRRRRLRRSLSRRSMRQRPTSPTCGSTARTSSTSVATRREALDSWAARIRRWTDQGLDVFAYFDNDAKVRAPYDAMGLIERLASATST